MKDEELEEEVDDVEEEWKKYQCSAQVFKRAGCHLKRAHLAR